MFSYILLWVRRVIGALFLTAFLTLLTIVLFLGYIAKAMIEKYDEEWTGRKIEVRKVRANIFRGTLSLYDLTVYEPSQVDTFFHVPHLFANLELTRFLSGNYDVTEIGLTAPFFSVIQQGSSFNFDDIIQRFVSGDSVSSNKHPGEPTRYRIENIHIDSARVRYNEKIVGSSLALTGFFAGSPLVAWDVPEHDYFLQTSLASGGSLHSTFRVDIETLRYFLNADFTEINIVPFVPYVKDVMNIDAIEGIASLSLRLNGDFNQPENIALSSHQSLQDFRLIDIYKDTILSVGKVSIGIDSIHTQNQLYDLGALTVDRPYLKFEIYPEGDNFSRLLMDTTSAAVYQNDSTITEAAYSNPFRLLVNYSTELLEQYVLQDYSADSVVISNCTVVYNDFTLHETFYFRLDSLDMKSGPLNSKDSQLNFHARSRINNTGIMDAHLGFDPHNLENMEMVYSIKDLRISSFSPYSTYYVAHPFWDGLIYYSNETKILNHIITSKNKLEVKKIEVGKKVKNATAFDLPLRLAVAILKDIDGNVNLDIPVEGNLDDPNYKLGKVIWSIVKNLLVKAATSPYRLLARALKVDEDDLKSVKFEYLSDSLSRKQQQNLATVARVLKMKPELKIQLVYLPAASDELEMLAAYEAKKRYILKIDTLREDEPNAEQLKQIQMLSINDTAFVEFLNRHLLFEGSLTAIEKCKRYIGRRRLSARMNNLLVNRRELISNYLTEVCELTPENFEIINGADGQVSDGIPQFAVQFGLTE